MKLVGIIPARMAASRFPGKPLAPLAGRPMIEPVYRRAERCKHLAEVYLATCDQAIYDAVRGFGGRAVMTADTHVRCTDRVAEAAEAIEADVVVNIQGDEPLIHPTAIAQLGEAILGAAPDIPCVNLCNVITREEDFRNPNQIKAVCDQTGDALYMSRQPVPTTKEWGKTRVLRQLGMIAFRKEFLQVFARLSPTPLEQAESADMLRAIEHGYRVRMEVSPYESFGVDTPADLRTAESRLQDDQVALELFGPNLR
jgi:3-deoxy-manno-octulosonate cytidylyltransferase (CMP-KDO synthetase)